MDERQGFTSPYADRSANALLQLERRFSDKSMASPTRFRKQLTNDMEDIQYGNSRDLNANHRFGDVWRQLKTGVYQNKFAVMFLNNKYLRLIKSQDPPASKLVYNSTHCAAKLQRHAQAVGISLKELKLPYMAQVTQDLIDQEYSYLDSLFEDESVATHGPGLTLHQGVLTGSHQYLLHYNVRTTKKTTWMFISKKNFEEAVERVNENIKAKLVDWIDTLPFFKGLSKTIRRKLISSGSLIAMP